MCEDFEVIYSRDGKNLTTLVQEWINENYDNLVRHCSLEKIEYNQTDK